MPLPAGRAACKSGTFRTQILRFNVDIDHRLPPVAGDSGRGPGVVPVHVDAADAIVRRLRDRIPGQDNLAGIVSVECLYVGGRCGGALGVGGYDSADKCDRYDDDGTAWPAVFIEFKMFAPGGMATNGNLIGFEPA